MPQVPREWSSMSDEPDGELPPPSLKRALGLIFGGPMVSALAVTFPPLALVGLGMVGYGIYEFVRFFTHDPMELDD